MQDEPMPDMENSLDNLSITPSTASLPKKAKKSYPRAPDTSERPAIEHPEAIWRCNGTKLCWSELISTTRIDSAPDWDLVLFDKMDWRYYCVLYDWASTYNPSLKNDFLLQTKDFTLQDFNVLCYQPIRRIGDTLPSLPDLPVQIKRHRGNHDGCRDAGLAALQFLYADEELDKHDLATFRHHLCSPVLSRYFELLTRIAKLRDRVWGWHGGEENLLIAELARTVSDFDSRSADEQQAYLDAQDNTIIAGDGLLSHIDIQSQILADKQVLFNKSFDTNPDMILDHRKKALSQERKRRACAERYNAPLENESVVGWGWDEPKRKDEGSPRAVSAKRVC